MRAILTVCCVLLWYLTFSCPAPSRKPPVQIPDVKALLRELSETLLKQDKPQNSWIEHALRDIAVLQVQAGDRDGAWASIRKARFQGIGFQSIHDVNQYAETCRSDNSVINWTYRTRPGTFKNVRFELEKVLRLKDPHLKSHTLRQCAVSAMRANDPLGASRLLDQAIEARKLIRDQEDNHLLCWIADAQAEVGLIDEAFQTVSKFTREQYHDRVRRQLSFRFSDN